MCARALSELDSADSSLGHLQTLSGVSGGTRTSPPLAAADISIHTFMAVGLVLACVGSPPPAALI